jgi:hypothetical protein
MDSARNERYENVLFLFFFQIQPSRRGSFLPFLLSLIKLTVAANVNKKTTWSHFEVPRTNSPDRYFFDRPWKQDSLEDS